MSNEWIDAGVVMFLIVANAILGFVQELKSVMSLAALQSMSSPVATVMRDGASMAVDINDIVVGDVVLLKQGDQVPADLRVAQALNLEVDEALLTGESVPIFKHTDPLPLPKQERADLIVSVALGDRSNMAFRQTTVVAGTGVGVVVAVGEATKVGQLSERLLSAGNPKTPLERKMAIFMYSVFGMAIILAIIIFGVTGFTFEHDTIVYASATGIAILPESLIAVVTVTLSLATSRMAARKAIVRKMGAVEILGNVTNICSDKTGTLTEGKMVVKRFWPVGSKYIYHVTGGTMDATGGFGLEHDPTDPDAPPVEPGRRSSRAASRASRAGTRASRAASGTGAASVGSIGGTVSGRPSTATGESRRFRAPSYAHTVAKVSQGLPESDFSAVQKAAEELALVCAMCNNTQLQHDEEEDKLIGTGNPTELALQVLAYKLQRSPYYFEEDEGWLKCGQWAFDSGVKCMSVGLVRDAELKEEDEASGREDGDNSLECKVLLKGAPEAVLPKCPGANVDEVMAKVAHLAGQGYRVLACAARDDLRLADRDGARLHDIDRHLAESNMRFVGLVVVYDPPREESYVAVRKCKEAGVTFHMVTGDHHGTAEAIARKLGILEDHQGRDRVTTGPVFDAMTEEMIDLMEELPLVIARCSPESKVKMVEALHRRRRIVAMTGDGINDAPAIKIADVGACMGIAGTDVTKGAADIVLADDNIATLVNAVEEGRHVAASIRKFIVHLLTSNIAEVIVLMIGLALRDDNNEVVFPLSPLQILWVNMFTSTPPAIGLSLDEKNPALMQQPPDHRPLFSLEVMTDQFIYGIILGGLTFGGYLVVIFGFGDGELGTHCNKTSGEHTCHLVWTARTTAFATLNTLLLFHGYVCRDPRQSVFARSWLSNKVLLWSLIVGFALLMPVIYIPGVARTLFRHAYISWEWVIVLVCIVLHLLLTDLYKFVKRQLYGENHWEADGGRASAGIKGGSRGARTVITEDGGRIEMIPV